MAVLLAVLLLLSSCDKKQAEELETVAKVETEKTIADYPSEITIDNYEEFLRAPQAVIDHFAQKEIEAQRVPTRSATNEFNETSRSNPLYGHIQGYKTDSWISIPDVIVNTFGANCDHTTTSNSSAHFNYYLPTTCHGPLCMTYHTIPLDGVTTFDLIYIGRHLLGIEPFTRAQQFLAADVDRSGVVSSLDMIDLRMMILSIHDNWQNSKNVIFVSTQDYYTMQSMIDNTGTVNPVFLKTVGTTDDCLSSAFRNRQAIKTGDINGSW